MRTRPFGFNVFAYASGNFGLAAAARNTITMLEADGVPLCVNDQRLLDSRSSRSDEYARLEPSAFDRMPWGVNLFHLNPDDILDRIPLQWIGLPIERRMNICVPFWELPRLPRAWADGLEMMDLVLAPTRYVLDTVREALPDATVEHFPQAVYLPAGIAADRERWGLPADRTVFLCGFDMQSDIERKNPWAAIDAFEEAFGSGEDALLVVKVSNADVDPAVTPHLERLRERVASLPNVVLLDEQLVYRDVLNLYASIDVLVSLHRAEGLGLVLMEAMSLGRPVVATAWSGSLDFTDEGNSCLVGYDLVPVSATHAGYHPSSTGHDALLWAQPRQSEAAVWMRRLASDPALRERIGRAAAASMVERRALHSSGRMVAMVRDMHESFDPHSPEHVSRASRIARWRWTQALRRMSRVPGGVLRALGRRAAARGRTGA